MTKPHSHFTTRLCIRRAISAKDCNRANKVGVRATRTIFAESHVLMDNARLAEQNFEDFET
jgi:hypothetical protein